MFFYMRLIMTTVYINGHTFRSESKDSATVYYDGQEVPRADAEARYLRMIKYNRLVAHAAKLPSQVRMTHVNELRDK